MAGVGEVAGGSKFCGWGVLINVLQAWVFGSMEVGGGPEIRAINHKGLPEAG